MVAQGNHMAGLMQAVKVSTEATAAATGMIHSMQAKQAVPALPAPPMDGARGAEQATPPAAAPGPAAVAESRGTGAASECAQESTVDAAMTEAIVEIDKYVK